MSARPRDLYEGAGNFSLRNALATHPQAVASAPQAVQSTAQLKFNLGSLAPPPPPSPSPSPAAHGFFTPPIPTGQGTTQRFPQALNMRFTQSLPVAANVVQNVQETGMPINASNIPNLSFTSMSSMPHSARPPSILGGRTAAAAKQEQANAQADVMRLTAYVDELTSRLKKCNQKLQDTESQLHRTSQALASERQHGEATIKAYKSDLSMAHDVETKLRAELSNRPKRSALTESHFMQSVGSVLQDEHREHEASEKLLDLESKVKGMCDAKVLIESEMAALKELKAKAQSELDDIRSRAQEVRALSNASENEISEKVAIMQAQCKAAQKDAVDAKAALDSAKAAHAAVNDHMADAMRQETQLVAAISSLNASKIEAEAGADAAKAELQKMLLEHGDVANKLSAARDALASLKHQEKAAQDGLAVAKQKWTDATVTSTSTSTSADNAELHGYTTKIDALRMEIAATQKEAEVAKATKQRIDVAKVELEGYEAKLEQVQIRLAESESLLCKTTEKLRGLNNEIEKKEAIGAVPAFQLDAGAKIPESLLFQMGGETQVVAHPETVPQVTATSKPRTSVFGASAPSKTLCSGAGANSAAIAARTLPACAGTLALVAVDAPPHITLHRVNFLGDRHAFLDVSAAPSKEDPSSQMINAVVADLKTKLTEISEQQPVWRAVAPLA